MSSTKRGAVRAEADFYETPSWAVDALLNEWDPPVWAKNWLEPCAGNGAIIQAVENAYKWTDNARVWDAVELMPERLDSLRNIGAVSTRIEIADYLTWRSPLVDAAGRQRKYDIAMTNPAFNVAMAIIQKALLDAEIVIMLLRLAFLETEVGVEELGSLVA